MTPGFLRQRSYARLSSSSACPSVSATTPPPYWPKCPRSSGSSTVFILHCSDEGRDFRGVLDSLRSLDAAGDIDGIWLHTADEASRSEEHTSELQSRPHLVCRLLLEKKKSQPQQLPTLRHKSSRYNT